MKLEIEENEKIYLNAEGLRIDNDENRILTIPVTLKLKSGRTLAALATVDINAVEFRLKNE